MVKGNKVTIDTKSVESLSSNWKTMLQNQVIKTSEKTNWKTMLGEKPSFLKSQATARCCVAIDCEMVLTKTKSGDEVDALARVAIVDENNTVLMDEYCRPSDFIIDFKTDVSGIKPGHMKNAKSFAQIQPIIKKHLENRIVVGHAIHNDLRVCNLAIPSQLTRDTSRYIGLRLPNTGKVMSLKKLAAHWLEEHDFQEGSHDPVEDARMTMRLYKLKRPEWEKSLKTTIRNKKSLEIKVDEERTANNHEDDE